MLRKSLTKTVEAGVDEAGRGPLAGSVFAAAVILPSDFRDYRLDDSKKMSEKRRYLMRDIIMEQAIAWSIGEATSERIDQINIWQATLEAMNKAIDGLDIRPEYIIVDGPHFTTESGIDYQCIIGGDGKFASIAAASVLAKTARDDQMKELDKLYPQYGWAHNKGYPTPGHRAAILEYGLTPYHRRTFAGVVEHV